MTCSENQKTHPVLFLFFLAGVLLLSACGSSAGVSASSASDTSYSAQIFAMDTYMTVTAYGTDAEEAVLDVVSEINRLDALLSAENEDSEVYALNLAGGGSVSEDTAYLLARALEIADLTDGAFDIAVYPLMELWGFPSEEYYVPSAEEISALLPAADISNVVFDASGAENASDSADVSADAAGGTLTLENGARIDLGGIVKGYLSDRCEAVFSEYDITGAICSLGGNIYAYGTKTDGSYWNIGIQDPAGESGTDVIASLKVSGLSVITSGGYERYFEQDGVIYHHILDPDTGYPADSGVSSATVVSADGTLADGLSTALFVMGEEDAITLWRENSSLFDFILVDEEGNITVTEGISSGLKTTSSAAAVTVVTVQ